MVFAVSSIGGHEQGKRVTRNVKDGKYNPGEDEKDDERLIDAPEDKKDHGVSLPDREGRRPEHTV